MSQHSANFKNKKKSAKHKQDSSGQLFDHNKNSDSLEESVHTEESANTEDSAHAQESTQKVKIEFPYSDLVRSKIPKAFDVAEKVASDWKNQGEFKDLGLPHPLADSIAAEALKKAKKVEKKLEEKGVFTIAKMGFELAKSQLNQLKKK